MTEPVSAPRVILRALRENHARLVTLARDYSAVVSAYVPFDDLTKQFDQLDAALLAQEQREAKLAQAVDGYGRILAWALGEGKREDGEFPMWPDTLTMKGQPKFWWRKEMRARANAVIVSLAPLPDPPKETT